MQLGDPAHERKPQPRASIALMPPTVRARDASPQSR
jgi:hypothetical protein